MNPIEKMQAISQPRTEKARGKQRQIDTTLEPVQERGVFGMDEDFAFRSSTDLPYRQSGIDVPLRMGGQYYTVPQPAAPQVNLPPMPQRGTDYSLKMRPKAPAYPKADPKDPSFFTLPPVREREISAPLQPRVTDMRVHVEKDHQQARPAFDVTIRFQFQMEPGSLS